MGFDNSKNSLHLIFILIFPDIKYGGRIQKDLCRFIEFVILKFSKLMLIIYAYGL